MKLAQAIYGQFVPDCTYHGQIGPYSPLSVYVIERLPGATYIEAPCKNSISIELSSEERSRQLNSVADFARYFDSCTVSRWSCLIL